jgi:hypothetical protein
VETAEEITQPRQRDALPNKRQVKRRRKPPEERRRKLAERVFDDRQIILLG